MIFTWGKKVIRDMWCPRGWMDTCISGGRPGVRQDATARAACRDYTAHQHCLHSHSRQIITSLSYGTPFC